MTHPENHPESHPETYPISLSMNGLTKALVLGAALLVFQGCLETRDSVKEVEEKQQLQKQVGSLQRSTADVNAKFQEVEEEISKLSARVDVVDNKNSKNDEKFEKLLGQKDAKLKELGDKINLHQEVLTKMEAQMTTMQAQLTAMQAQINQVSEDQKKAAASLPTAKPESGEKALYKIAEDFFAKHQWQDAAIAFEKYRKANPKGKHAAQALYKIGVSFQELGSKEEAKIFYKDVINQYPNSADAKNASSRLKSLK